MKIHCHGFLSENSQSLNWFCFIVHGLTKFLHFCFIAYFQFQISVLSYLSFHFFLVIEVFCGSASFGYNNIIIITLIILLLWFPLSNFVCHILIFQRFYIVYFCNLAYNWVLEIVFFEWLFEFNHGSLYLDVNVCKYGSMVAHVLTVSFWFSTSS